MLKIIDGTDSLCKPSLAKQVPAKYLEWVIENYRMKLSPFKTLERAVAFFDIDANTLAEQENDEDEDDVALDDLMRELEE